MDSLQAYLPNHLASPSFPKVNAAPWNHFLAKEMLSYKVYPGALPRFTLRPDKILFACQYINLTDSAHADVGMDWNKKAWWGRGRVTQKTKHY